MFAKLLPQLISVGYQSVEWNTTYFASFLLTPVFLNIGWWTKATPSDPSLPPSYLRGWSVWDTSPWSEAILYFWRLFSSALAHGQMLPLVLLPPREFSSVRAKASYNLLTQEVLHCQWWRWTKCCPKGCGERIIDNDIMHLFPGLPSLAVQCLSIT